MRAGPLTILTLILAAAVALSAVWRMNVSHFVTGPSYQKVVNDALATVDPSDDAAVATAKREAIRRILAEIPSATPSFIEPNARLIYFRTDAPGVVVPAEQRAKYPEQMSIILQHQYRNLRVRAKDIVVTASFKGAWETLTIPLAALISFEDQTAEFTIDTGDAGATDARAPTREQTGNDVGSRRSGLMTGKPYPYVYVNDDGSARELHPNERDYLETEFAPGDGAMPYVKSSYEERNGWGELRGFMERAKLPRGTAIHPAPAEDPSEQFNKAEYIEFLRSKGLEVIENPDGSVTTSKPRN